MGKLVLLSFLVLSLMSCKQQDTIQNKTVESQKPIASASATPITSKPLVVITRQQLLEPLLEQIKKQEQEMLPFDEPRHENGEQLDGRLRILWEQAYRRKQPYYEFNGDRYAVLHNGNPFVPQVCADFIIDTIDRTAGTWYLPSRRNPGKTVGRYDLRTSIKNDELDPRRLNELIQFFEKNPASFQFKFKGLGPTTKDTIRLKAWMKSLDVDVGDIIIIRGKVPWDHGKEEHNHSMFVTGLDDKDRVHLVTGNPIYPVERTLRIEGNRTPKRRVTYIIKLTDEFLKQLTGYDSVE